MLPTPFIHLSTEDPSVVLFQNQNFYEFELNCFYAFFFIIDIKKNMLKEKETESNKWIKNIITNIFFFENRNGNKIF